jgi:hypothetical protein
VDVGWKHRDSRIGLWHLLALVILAGESVIPVRRDQGHAEGSSIQLQMLPTGIGLRGISPRAIGALDKVGLGDLDRQQTSRSAVSRDQPSCGG